MTPPETDHTPSRRPATLPGPDASSSSTSGIARAYGPGLTVALIAAALAFGVNVLVPTASALLVAILAGVLLTNTTGLPDAAAPGLAIAAKRLLRIGIVLLGFQVSLADIAGLGAGMIAVVVVVVVTGLVVAEAAGRALGVVPAQRALIGAGFSICGAAAVAGVEGVVEDRRDEDVVTALALVVLFGTLMIPAVPLLAALFGLDPHVAGLWAGGSIHEVAQVVAAGGIIGSVALKTAVVVKLARVLMLAPVAVWFGRRSRRARAAGSATEASLPPLVPLFVVGFLVAVVVRSTGVVPVPTLAAVKIVQTLLLAAAMFALGCGVRVATLRTVGGRPVVLAAVTTVSVALVALGGALLAG